MSTELQPLDDAAKLRLVEELEALGLLRRDEHGRRWLTDRGHYVGSALTAFALQEQAEKDATVWPPGNKH
jgi:hypothetical protein